MATAILVNWTCLYQDELDSMFLDYAYDTSGIYVVSILLVDTNGCFNVLDLPDSLWVGFPQQHLRS